MSVSSEQHRAEIKEGLEELLRTREFTTANWERITGVDFGNEDELYSYVQKLHEYLFCGAEEPPEIPEDA